jgi:hypothetical protein
MNPILFLDFDGVLNSYPWRRDNRDLVFSDLDVANVLHLSAIVARTDCRIVISSTWRINDALDSLRATLTRAGFKAPERVIDVTPQTEKRLRIWDRPPRGIEIADWLATNPVDRYAILDDEGHDLAEHGDRAVLTDDWRGLTGEDADRVVAILTRAA